MDKKFINLEAIVKDITEGKIEVTGDPYAQKCVEAYRDVVLKRLAAEPAVNIDETSTWTRCKDRPPEKEGLYLVCKPAEADGRLFIPRIFAWKEETWWNVFDEPMMGIEYWMPLPASPTAEEWT